MRSISHRPCSSSVPESGLLKFLPGRTAFMYFCLGVSAPCVPGSSPFALRLWILGQSLPGDVAGWLPGGVANPSPFSSTDLCRHWFVVCCPPQVLIADLLWPPDAEDFEQTFVDESLELMECWLSHSPCFRSIEEYQLHICVKYPQLGELSNLSKAPNFLENQESGSRFACCLPSHLRLPHHVCQPCFLNK